MYRNSVRKPLLGACLTRVVRAFGAPGHIRVSYGSLPEGECLAAIQRLREGLQAILTDEVKAGASI